MLSLQLQECSSKYGKAERNYIIHKGYNTTDKSLPVIKLLVLQGTLIEVPVKISKDDECDTIVVSSEFLSKIPNLSHVKEKRSVVQNWRLDSNEESLEIVLNATLKICSHTY